MVDEKDVKHIDPVDAPDEELGKVSGGVQGNFAQPGPIQISSNQGANLPLLSVREAANKPRRG